MCLFSKVVKNTVIVFTGIKRKSIYFSCKSFFFFFFFFDSSHMYVCSSQLGSVHNSPVSYVVGFSVFVSFVLFWCCRPHQNQAMVLYCFKLLPPLFCLCVRDILEISIFV